MHEWFHSFYQCEEIRKNPVTGKFGILLPATWHGGPSWRYIFATDKAAMREIDIQEDSYRL